MLKIQQQNTTRLKVIVAALFISAATIFVTLVFSERIFAAPTCGDSTVCPPSNTPTGKRASPASPPLDVYTKGGKVLWLYYGNLRIDNGKSGDNKKTWDYAMNSGNTSSYELAEAGMCRDGKTPNDRLVVSSTGTVTREVVYAAEAGKVSDCSKKYVQYMGSPGNSDRKTSLFYRIKGQLDTIKLWNSTGSGEGATGSEGVFTKLTIDAPGWKVVYQNSEQNECSDVIAQKSTGDWVFFPMAIWNDVKDSYGFVEGAKSQDYASIKGDPTYEECRVYAPKVVNTYKTGIKDNKGVEPAKEFKLRVQETANYDEPLQVCDSKPSGDFDGYYYNILKPSAYMKVNEVLIKGLEDSPKSWKYEWRDSGSAKEVGPMGVTGRGDDKNSWLLSCKRTDDPKGDGNWAYHSLKIWEPITYGLTESSNRRLIDFSHVDMWSWKGGGDANNDGYKLGGGIADITAGEVSAANPNSMIDEPEGADGEEGASDEGTSCAIDGIGWIICPVMNFLAEANEKAFGFLQTLLSIPPSLTTDTATVTAWSRFRDLANIAFVIAFLVIIYSQITSVGISNYGIKKLLPKIAAAAILVNLSLFICQVLVDASNIAGAGLYSFTTGIVQLDPTQANGGSWTSIMTGLLAVGVGVLLIVAIIAAPTVLLALGLILLILIARQAFILILVVIAPLAFVAYLLPNTEGLFKKWWKALSATLLVYPIIGMIFGASTLASNILMQIANGGSGDDKQLLAIVALAVMAIPLFAVPAVLKGAMSGAGAIGAKLSNLQDRANRRASGDVKNRAGAELKDLGNRFTNRALSSTSKRGAAARFISGVGRRTNRDDRYKQNQTRRDAAQENFLNRGIDTSDPNNITATNRTSQRRVDAAAAKKTADTTNQIVGNLGAQSSMRNNTALYRAAATSSEATHHQEDTLKNQGKSDYYNDRRNDGHLAENIAARENSQADETNALNRAKVGSSTESIAARQAIASNKAAKGAEKIVDQRLERDFQTSDIGRSQSQGLKAVEGELEIEHGEQKNIFEGSDVGKAQAQAKKVIQGTAKVIEGEAELAYQTSDIGKVLEESNLGAQALVQNAKIATDLAYQKSDAGKAANVGGAVVQAQLDAAKTANSAVVEELKAGVSANGFDDPSSPNYIPDTTDPTYQAAVDLSAADIDKKAQTQRAAVASSAANEQYAREVMASARGDDGGALINTAQGIGGEAARTRAIASAVQTIDKQQIEAIATQKTNQGSHDPDKLFETMMDTSLPAERRAAAAGLLMDRGGDQHVEEVLDYLGTAVPTSADEADAILTMQKQVGADIGSRKPKGLGSSDLSRLKQGSFGASNVQRDNDGNVITDPSTGRPLFNPGAKQVGFEDSLIGRVNGGKIGAKELAGMGADELARLAHAVETRGNELDSDMYFKLQQSIGELTSDPNLKSVVDSPEQKALLQNIIDGTGVNGAINLQNLDYSRTNQPRQTL